MNKTASLFLSGILLLLAGAFALFASAAAQDGTPAAAKMTTTEKCLACHGPFDTLRETTAGFKAPSGETATPHQYVPHEDKKDIVECVECHQPHPVPLEDKSKAVKPSNIPYCYANCHHASTLQPCKTCH